MMKTMHQPLEGITPLKINSAIATAVINGALIGEATAIHTTTGQYPWVLGLVIIALTILGCLVIAKAPVIEPGA